MFKSLIILSCILLSSNSLNVKGKTDKIESKAQRKKPVVNKNTDLLGNKSRVRVAPPSESKDVPFHPLRDYDFNLMPRIQNPITSHVPTYEEIVAEREKGRGKSSGKIVADDFLKQPREWLNVPGNKQVPDILDNFANLQIQQRNPPLEDLIDFYQIRNPTADLHILSNDDFLSYYKLHKDDGGTFGFYN